MNLQGARVLVIDQWVPKPDTNAGDWIVFQYCRALVALGAEVFFWPHSGKIFPEATAVMRGEHVKVIESRLFVDLARRMGAGLSLVVAARPFCTAYIDLLRDNSGARVVYFAHDLHFLRDDRMAALVGDAFDWRTAEAIRRKEAYCMVRADETAVLSDVEAAVLRERMPWINVAVWPWIQPLCDCDATSPSRDRDVFRIMFLGGFGHPPNTDAVIWFISDIFPLICDEVPRCEFVVVGASPPSSLTKIAKSRPIRIVGYAKRLEPWFARSAVMVAPLRYGAGFKGKIALSMACNTPVVTTSIGAEGMGLVHGKTALVADTAEDFAAAVISLHREPATRKSLAKLGRNIVREAWSESCAQEFLRERFGD